MHSATLDPACAMGLRPLATTRSADKADLLRMRGAAKVIVLEKAKDDVVRLHTAAGLLGLDAAVDYRGDQGVIRLCVDALRPGVRSAIVSGELGDAPLPLTACDRIRQELSVHGVRGSTLADEQAVVRLLAHRQIESAIAPVMKLSKISQAHRRLESGEVNGRIVLESWD